MYKYLQSVINRVHGREGRILIYSMRNCTPGLRSVLCIVNEIHLNHKYKIGGSGMLNTKQSSVSKPIIPIEIMIVMITNYGCAASTTGLNESNEHASIEHLILEKRELQSNQIFDIYTLDKVTGRRSNRTEI